MKKFRKSFKWALEGLLYNIVTQRNFKIHLFMMIVAISGALALQFKAAEWGVVFTAIALVLMAEAFNTAIEKAVDCATDEFDDNAKRAKDSAAAAVLIISFFVGCMGIALYAGKIIRLIKRM